VTVGPGVPAPQIVIWRRTGPGGAWGRQGPHGGGAAAASILEVALPLRDLAPSGGGPPATLSVFLAPPAPGGGEGRRPPGTRAADGPGLQPSVRSHQLDGVAHTTTAQPGQERRRGRTTQPHEQTAIGQTTQPATANEQKETSDDEGPARLAEPGGA